MNCNVFGLNDSKECGQCKKFLKMGLWKDNFCEERFVDGLASCPSDKRKDSQGRFCNLSEQNHFVHDGFSSGTELIKIDAGRNRITAVIGSVPGEFVVTRLQASVGKGFNFFAQQVVNL